MCANNISNAEQALLIHLIFHPHSAHAAALAHSLYLAFNADSLLPALRLPTVCMPDDGSGLPPSYHLQGAQRHVVIVLADDYMVVEDPAPEGRQTWAELVAQLFADCASKHGRFLPVQLSSHAWPLHPSLSQTSFIRAYVTPQAEQARMLERRMVIEISRYLLGRNAGEAAAVKIFISHAKTDVLTDGGEGQAIFQALVSHLDATKPVESWIDSGQIYAGADFGQAIETGINDCAILVLLTSTYSSRTWCRKEVLLAKRAQRPMVVLNALRLDDMRSFPYLGNVPMLSWRVDATANDIARVVDLLLKEQLRLQYVELVLQRSKKADDFVCTRAPELATLVHIPEKQTVLYPDPLLGDEELEILQRVTASLSTPLQRVAQDKTLRGCKIALSISESDDIERVGLFPEHLQAALLEISRYLLARGASLAYGGHLGAQGYTLALFELVRAHRANSDPGLKNAERIINYLGWPLPYARLPLAERARYQDVVSFIRVPRPDGVQDLEPEVLIDEPVFFADDTPARRYAWARGMSAMRKQQTKDVHARICIGGACGKTLKSQADGSKVEAWYKGRIPGVVEEILFSLRAQQALYLCGAFGGATRMAIQLLQGETVEKFSWDYQQQAPHAQAMKDLYVQRGIAWEDYADMSAFFRSVGVVGLARNNGLSEEENKLLFTSTNLEQIIELILLGLTRKRSGEGAPPPSP